MYKEYKPKTILNVHKSCDGGWFWNKYSAFPYKGCTWGCSYCYSREKKYDPHKSKNEDIENLDDPFSEYIEIKLDAPELLEKALKNNPKDIIYIDSYQAIESKYKYVRKMLEVCEKLGFPVFINEKSTQVIKDIDILTKIAEKTYMNVGWSIVFAQDDSKKKAFEPKAPSIKSRFSAMKKLADSGIYTGTVLMPVLPYICDTNKNLEAIIKRTKEAGGKYVLYGGLTLFGYCGEFFYKYLENYNKSLVKKYKELFSSKKNMQNYTHEVYKRVLSLCKKHEIAPFIERPVSFYPEVIRANRSIAGKLFLNSRHLNLTGESSYRQWAYFKAAKSIDELEDDVVRIYNQDGKAGLQEIPGIGDSIADKIIELMKKGFDNNV